MPTLHTHFDPTLAQSKSFQELSWVFERFDLFLHLPPLSQQLKLIE